MGFLTSCQPRSCVTPNFPKWGSDTKISTKKQKSATIRLSKNFQQQSCSAINYLSNSINILAGDDLVPVKFWPKGTNPNAKDARFTFHMRSAVQSALADLLVSVHISWSNAVCVGVCVWTSLWMLTIEWNKS